MPGRKMKGMSCKFRPSRVRLDFHALTGVSQGDAAAV